MKYLFLSILFLSSISHADEFATFGGLIGATLCGDSKNPHAIAGCYYTGQVESYRMGLKQTLCETSKSLHMQIENKIVNSDLSEFITSDGSLRAKKFSLKMCGINGDLNARSNTSFFQMASESEIQVTSENSTSQEGAIIQIISSVLTELFKEDLRRISSQMEHELSPERLREQLNQWLTTPKEALCRGDLTHGDLGKILRPVIGCEG